MLLAEFDKADPDVPNNLLCRCSLEFIVDETGELVNAKEQTAPLVVLTTNEERDLPAAFLRRCVELELALPKRNRLLEIAAAHFEDVSPADLGQLAIALLGAEDELQLSPAEFIDTVRAARDLEVEPDGPAWEALSAITAWKPGSAR